MMSKKTFLRRQRQNSYTWTVPESFDVNVLKYAFFLWDHQFEMFNDALDVKVF